MTPAEELKYHFREAYRTLALPGARVRVPRPSSDPPASAQGHFHLRAELFLQRGGTTRFRFPGEVVDLGPGEVLVVPPRLHHAETIVPGGQPFRNVVLYADEAALSCHLADGTAATGPRIAYPEHREGPVCGPVATWLADAVRVSREVAGADTVVADLIRSVLAMTLKLLELPPSGADPEPLPVVRCRRMVHEDLGDPELSVARLADRLGLSADYLSHLFRTVRGEKLTTYIEDQRLRRAAELLLQTGLSVKEAAWASGFAQPSYFIRRFRERWGTSPGDWRRTAGLKSLTEGRFPGREARPSGGVGRSGSGPSG